MATSFSSPRSLWSKGIVPYSTDLGLPAQKRVTKAISHWEQNTNICFVEHTSEPDFVTFRHSTSGCSNKVGRQGGEQFFDQKRSCKKRGRRSTKFEIRSVIGTNRVVLTAIVMSQYVKANAEHNFNQKVNNAAPLSENDYASIMHYGKKAFSKNGMKTIVAKNGTRIGQRKSLSQGDVSAIHSIHAGEFAKRT